MRRFEVYSKNRDGGTWQGPWAKYKKREGAEFAVVNFWLKLYPNELWKLRDRDDNSESVYGA